MNYGMSKAEQAARAAHHGDVHPAALERAREARNDRCVGCGRPPMGGGLRCHPCFRIVARPGRAMAGQAHHG